MKSYIKPAIEVVELSVKENIASLPQGVSTGTDENGALVTSYDLGTYNTQVLASM